MCKTKHKSKAWHHYLVDGFADLAVAFLAGAAFLLDEALDFVFAVPFLSAAAFVVAAAFLLEEGVVPFFVVDLAFVDRADVFLPWLVDGFFAVTRFVVEDLVFF